MRMMRIINHSLCWTLVLAWYSFHEAKVEAAEFHGRAYVTLVEVDSDEAPLTKNSSPGSGKQIRLYLDSSSESDVLVVVLDRQTRGLMRGWRPQLLRLTPQKMAQLPQAPERWMWESSSGPLDFYFVFMKAGFSAAQEARKLVESVQNQNLDARQLRQLSRQLREQLSILVPTHIASSAKPLPADTAGVFRTSIDEDFKTFSQKVPFDENQPGQLILAWK